MEDLVNKLCYLWLYDIEVFSTGWLYYWLLIPFMFYFVFFTFKWMVLTLPLWLPIVIINVSFNSKNKNIKKDTEND